LRDNIGCRSAKVEIRLVRYLTRCRDSRGHRVMFASNLGSGCVHRLENPGLIPLALIEVQSGAYLGEDDIVRVEDSYGRT
jgi:hypothetical protein